MGSRADTVVRHSGEQNWRSGEKYRQQGWPSSAKYRQFSWRRSEQNGEQSWCSEATHFQPISHPGLFLKSGLNMGKPCLVPFSVTKVRKPTL